MVVSNSPLSPLSILYVYVILFPFTPLNFAIFSVPLPNFNFSIGAVFDIISALLVSPYIFSVYVDSIVIVCPSLYVPDVGLITFILDNIGATVSFLIMIELVSETFPAVSIALNYIVESLSFPNVIFPTPSVIVRNSVFHSPFSPSFHSYLLIPLISLLESSIYIFLFVQLPFS